MASIDWRMAQRVAEMVAGTATGNGTAIKLPPTPVGDVAAEISSYTGLDCDGPPPVELVDRPQWISANLASARPLLEPLTERLTGTLDGELGPLSGVAGSASGMLLGAQVGALTGMLSQRVLGQYDLALLDPSVEPRLLLVAPNLAHAATSLAVNLDDLVTWVTIHEVTHAVQFSGTPWLRDHLGGMIEELIDTLQPPDADDRRRLGDLAGLRNIDLSKLRSGLRDLDLSKLRDDLSGLRDLSSLRDLSGLRDNLSGLRENFSGLRDSLSGVGDHLSDMSADLRSLVAKARRGELLRMTLGEERWELVDRMQATMSLIEGHADHVMDAVGAKALPSLPRLRAAMTLRRRTRPLTWRLLERFLGLDLKMRQYEVGRRFCDAVVSAAGPEGLAPAWRSPDCLPTTAELDAPALWLARVGAPAGK